ncbi:neural cell adhesion molecule 2 isoform X1 [Glossina fuscipes]|uniref:Neural cell adhesion molecule 2 isoform X1 n=3 Tax=Glossina TaxID=7393 RepID=A0A9C5Z839_9MUSC|nr:neural cell adhesion molecule 2 isoform X1 [Glossina fuscipes]XP_037891605.1 neural cell adhesion molecule 2 isoform X1 [Glossina fuscipes]XP_037891606.1 neural cell adhesion molecule 2 isoform X1 [Glossina fuscipes]XP_037891607.1 neural cell adhesion molecule 2 isoform X1 [Glossina fuscipes]XP_037891608.1 neural cell adhesion molecule 2 isoform X1 [Glossina fuscipes]XP_037891609.1 neural cell adhesion molecule 2 isoform X1 [Glossina fuscipes]XP_037891610.1 neural cell adhesion molecule 2 
MKRTVSDSACRQSDIEKKNMTLSEIMIPEKNHATKICLMAGKGQSQGNSLKTKKASMLKQQASLQALVTATPAVLQAIADIGPKDKQLQQQYRPQQKLQLQVKRKHSHSAVTAPSRNSIMTKTALTSPASTQTLAQSFPLMAREKSSIELSPPLSLSLSFSSSSSSSSSSSPLSGLPVTLLPSENRETVSSATLNTIAGKNLTNNKAQRASRVCLSSKCSFKHKCMQNQQQSKPNNIIANYASSRNDISCNETTIGCSTKSTFPNMKGRLSLHFHKAHLEYILRLLIVCLMFVMSMQLHTATVSASVLNKHEPMFISRSETFKFVSGDTIVLPCEVANTDPYVVAWKRGIAILTAGSVKVTPDPRVRLVNGFNLQIRDAVPQDAGDYICQIATMEPREITHTVEILVPPRIHHISTSGHLQVKKGSSVRIECSASGNPTPNVTWSRKNNILPNGEEKLHSHILSIENVDRHKGGVYICTANNGVGQAASSQVVLHVLYPPEITVERPIVFSGEGHEAMLVCIVHGETQPEVIWFKDTMQLDTTERHIMESRGSRHTLIIRKVHPQDFGNYSCVAENQLGKSRKTLQLSGKPNVAVFSSPPISQYKDRYNISWTVDSHTPIEEYKLSFRRLQQGQELDNSIDSHSSSMLQMYGGSMGGGIVMGNNHNYRLSGGMSSLGSFGTYNSVGNVVQWGRNDWRDVVLPAMPLSHHYTQGMSYMIRGLDPDQHYEATVQARNRYGWSDHSQSFVFSTSSNDGLTNLSTYLNNDHLSDNEMRDLSVTFYGSTAPVIDITKTLNYFSIVLIYIYNNSI